MEIWRDILGYEGLYQVSNLGNVKRLVGKGCRKERLLKYHTKSDGYKEVLLSKNCICKHYRVHRLVAAAFIPNPDNLPQVNHKDEDKTNNTVDNLEYCDTKYNSNYGSRNQRIAWEKNKPVLCVETNMIFPSRIAAEEWLGINGSHQSICRCCLNRPSFNTAYGYHWKYIE